MRLLVAVFLLLLCAAPAQARIELAADAAGDRGYVWAFVKASPDVKAAAITEDGERIAAFAMPEDGVKVIGRVTRWRCDRLNRVFTVTADTGETATFSVRTPSCVNRLVVSAPRRVEPGERFEAEVRDTWGTGLTAALVCFRDDCDQIDLADGQATAKARFSARAKGRASVVLRAAGQRELAPVAVGVKPRPRAAGGPAVLLTGDSLMQSVDAFLGDTLADRLNLIGDVRVAAGLSHDSIVNWPAYAREQVRRHHPNATVIFLGTNDGYAMDGVECCGPEWEAEYARRAHTVMRTYAQDGAGAVIWITIPAAADPRRNPAALAVTRALVHAARDLPTVAVLRADRIFTPRGVYRSHMRVGGRRVRVRQSDGIHLTAAGAKLAANAIARLLRRVRLL